MPLFSGSTHHWQVPRAMETVSDLVWQQPRFCLMDSDILKVCTSAACIIMHHAYKQTQMFCMLFACSITHTISICLPFAAVWTQTDTNILYVICMQLHAFWSFIRTFWSTECAWWSSTHRRPCRSRWGSSIRGTQKARDQRPGHRRSPPSNHNQKYEYELTLTLLNFELDLFSDRFITIKSGLDQDLGSIYNPKIWIRPIWDQNGLPWLIASNIIFQIRACSDQWKPRSQDFWHYFA